MRKRARQGVFVEGQSGFSNRLLAVAYYCGIINGQRSTVNGQRSTVNAQRSTVNAQQ